MFQTSQIKHSHATISTTAHKNVNAVGAKSNIEYLFIVSDELGFGSQGWDVPYCTSGINARSNNQAWRQVVPV
jgi:hypothetical protein